MHSELMSPRRLVAEPQSLVTLPTEVEWAGCSETSRSKEVACCREAGEEGENTLSLGVRLTITSMEVARWEDPIQQCWKDCVCVCVCVGGGGGGGGGGYQ